jgi:hypothetical protein
LQVASWIGGVECSILDQLFCFFECRHTLFTCTSNTKQTRCQGITPSKSRMPSSPRASSSNPVDLWSTLDEESKSSFKQFILNARPSAPRGVSAEERLKYYVGKMPANLDKVIATRWSTVPSRKDLS